jgi:hypothetical protein
MKTLNAAVPPALLAACLLACGCAAQRGPVYDLRKIPTFRPGDRAVLSRVNTSTTIATTTDGQVVDDTRETTTAKLVETVLAVDAAGRVQRFRTEAGDVVRQVEAPRPKEQAFTAAIELKTVLADAARAGSVFEGDPRTVASPDMTQLSAPQIALVKELLLGSQKFAAYPEDFAVLMPARAIPVGHTWRPSKQALEHWVALNPVSGKMSGRVEEAHLTLASVSDGVATVKGEFRLSAVARGIKISPEVAVTMQIDTRTGLWGNRSGEVRIRARHEGVSVISTTGGGTTVRLERGGGEAPALPAGLKKLGWAAAGEDTNSYKNYMAGVSLNVPAGYAPQEPAPGEIAKFSSPADTHVTLRITDVRKPVEMDDLLPSVIENLKAAMKGYSLVEHERFSLPDNVPAALVLGRIGEGDQRVTLVSVVAIEGRRIVAVTAAAPSKPLLVDEIKRVAKTLRVFEPDMSRAQKQP